MIYYVSYESEFCFELYSKTGKWVLSWKHDNASSQDMYENGKPDIVLKTVKSFNIKELLLKFWFKKKV